MFQNEYRKANDSIHAPEEILQTIKAQSEDNDFIFKDPVKRHRWASVLGYAGIAVSAAVLAILVIRPFHTDNKTASAAPAAAMESIQENKAVTAAGAESAPAEMYSTFSTQDTGSDSARLDRVDGDEDEYVLFNNEPDPSYDDIFQMLIPSDPEAVDLEESAQDSIPLSESKAVSSLIQDNSLHAFDQVFPLDPELSVIEVVQDSDLVYLIGQKGDTVETSVYRADGMVGKAFQSGIYQSFEIKEASMFDDAYSISSHHVLLIESVFAPDLSKADATDPGSFCPSFGDGTETRPLLPEEITCLTEGSRYTVYGALETTDSVRMLYIFAELGE